MTALPPELVPSRFSCPLCKRPHISLATKKKHMRTHHPKQKKQR